MRADPRWELLEALFEQAASVPPEERATWLDEHCGDDSELRGELESLLAAHGDAPGFLKRLRDGLVGPGAEGLLQDSGDAVGRPASDAPVLVRELLKGSSEDDAQLARLTTALADRYAIEREIGSGGMATVYLAQDVRHDRKVAIKVLKPELAAALGHERFLREITTTANLRHPHVLPLYDSGEAGEFLFYVMPYVEGESLRDRLSREKQLSLDHALQVARDVADALGYAHEHGVIHRDVKPENVLLESGHAVVTDFGIARAISEAGGDKLTETGIAVGTPTYMSPEHAAGSSDLDQRSDVYSLACVVYEMLAGEAPFTGPTADVVLRKHITAEPPSLAANRPDLPVNVASALQRGLAKTPADRYGAALQLIEDLTQTTATAPRRLRAAVLGVGVALALVAGGWLVTRALSLGGSGVSDPPRLVVLPFENLGSPEDEYFADGIADEVRARLTRLSGITVIASQSALLYKNTTKTPQQIGDELDIDYILNATVSWQRTPGTPSRIRLRPQLISASDAENVWADVYDEALTEVFAVQTAIAERVVEAMGVALGRGERRSLEAVPTANIEAYNLYLQGRFLLNQGGDGIRKALEVFERAIALDSTYALAHAGIADVYAVIATFGDLPPHEAFPRAEAAARRAFQLDSSLAEPRSTLAGVAGFYDWDWKAAAREYRRLHELYPNYASGAHPQFLYYVEERREEAIAEATRGVERDPLNPIAASSLGLLLIMDGQYPQADTLLRSSLDVLRVWLSYRMLGLSYALQDRHAEAIAVLDTAVTLSGRHPWSVSVLAWSLARSGDRPRAAALLDELISRRRDRYVQSSAIAIVSGALGRRDEIFDWLERAYLERDGALLYLRPAAWWSPEVLTDPRYDAFWERLRFP
jgi:serine/threonine-protein kinase